MGGFFGAVSKNDVIEDVFFGTDYHSHLGTRTAGMAAVDSEIHFQREIHSIENSPFRTKFSKVLNEMKGNSAIGCISDYDPQPLLIKSRHGLYAICVTGYIQNLEELVDQLFEYCSAHFNARTSGEVNATELIASLINQKSNFVDGIKYAQSKIKGTASILILKENGSLIAARDKVGRLPIAMGKNSEGYCVAFEAFAFHKLGYEDVRELGPSEIVEVTYNGYKVLSPATEEMRICSFLWSYYGYPTSNYEGRSVELMRYENGAIMADNDIKSGMDYHIDYVGGVPDSGTPHAIGYANKSGLHFARAFIKYTPTWARSFTPNSQKTRNKIAKMKQIPVAELIKDKSLLFVDDSVVRGTQLRETVDFLYENGAKEVHIRSACPPIMFGCKYLNFSRATDDMELIARRMIMKIEGEDGFNYIEEYCDGSTERGKKLRKAICEELHLASIEFQSLEGVTKSIGLDRCKLCTYCWDGKE